MANRVAADCLAERLSAICNMIAYCITYILLHCPTLSYGRLNNVQGSCDGKALLEVHGLDCQTVVQSFSMYPFRAQ